MQPAARRQGEPSSRMGRHSRPSRTYGKEKAEPYRKIV
jgi:hypothetical protein